MATTEHGGIMKKLLIILTLCAMQLGCASYGKETVGRTPLLAYADLGAEISVTRVLIEDDVEDSDDIADFVAATH